MVPTGQYDPTRIINFGSNRWGLKPEIGYSSVHGRWIFDFAAGVWFFTTNDDFLGSTRTQDPIGSFEAHVSYNFPRGVWVAIDANYFTGGRTEIDGVEKDDLQRNSRVGFTLSLPLGGPTPQARRPHRRLHQLRRRLQRGHDRVSVPLVEGW